MQVFAPYIVLPVQWKCLNVGECILHDTSRCLCHHQAKQMHWKIPLNQRLAQPDEIFSVQMLSPILYGDKSICTTHTKMCSVQVCETLKAVCEKWVLVLTGSRHAWAQRPLCPAQAQWSLTPSLAASPWHPSPSGCASCMNPASKNKQLILLCLHLDTSLP